MKNMITWQSSYEAKVELVYRIKLKRNWIKRPSNIFQLLDKPRENLKISWNEEYLDELSHLIYLLHKEDLIGCIGNRGSFSAVENHLYDFKDKKIKNGTLRKLSYKINKNWKKYEHRLSAVNLIISAIHRR